MDSSELAAILSLSGVVITGLLTALTAIRAGKDRRERNADRRKIEEETTDVILKRVRGELDRAYAVIDMKDQQLRRFTRWLNVNRPEFARLGIAVPEIEVDEGPTLYDQAQKVRVEIDRAAADDAVADQRRIDDDRRESDSLIDRDRRDPP